MNIINRYLQEIKKMYHDEIIIQSPHGVKNKIRVGASDHKITEEESILVKKLIKDEVNSYRDKLYKHYLEYSKENSHVSKNVSVSYFNNVKVLYVSYDNDHREIMFETCNKLKGQWGIYFDKKHNKLVYNGVSIYSC
jgi:hypothetical protein